MVGSLRSFYPAIIINYYKDCSDAGLLSSSRIVVKQQEQGVCISKVSCNPKVSYLLHILFFIDVIALEHPLDRRSLYVDLFSGL